MCIVNIEEKFESVKTSSCYSIYSRLISRALAQFHALDPNTVPLWDREGRRVKHFDTDPTVLKFLAGLVAEIPTHVEHDAEQNDRLGPFGLIFITKSSQ